MTIGYTSGVFDLFHIGHLNILRRAKELCDYLIAAVSTDELVCKTKGKYPVIPFNDRMEIVKAIRYVDEVVPQTTIDKIPAWKKFQFNKVFIGNDWKGTERWNAIERSFEGTGVEIVYLQRTDGVSSTELREKIKARMKH